MLPKPKLAIHITTTQLATKNDIHSRSAAFAASRVLWIQYQECRHWYMYFQHNFTDNSPSMYLVFTAHWWNNTTSRRHPMPFIWPICFYHLLQEAQLSQRDRAMRRVSWNLANCHATVQKLLVRQVLNKLNLRSWRVTVGQCVINMCTQPWHDQVACIVLQVLKTNRPRVSCGYHVYNDDLLWWHFLSP